jgi:hypothetical protein
MAEWWFPLMSKGAIVQETVLGEFFASQAIDSVVDSLVREFVQNSLDAATGREQVEVCFSIGTMDAKTISGYLDGLKEHIDVIDKSVASRLSKKCRYLVAEDFGTNGLRGDPGEVFRDPKAKYPDKNDFFYFVRSQGASEKSSTERGSWGVGKFTYPMASTINSFFTFTIRDDKKCAGGPGPLLIGQSFLKNHMLKEKVYTPHGWWGASTGSGVDRFPMPLSAEKDLISRFNFEFDMFRDDEPGLSVIIPYVDDDMTVESLLRSVLRNYAATILLGQLRVVVREVDGDQYEFDSTNLIERGEEIGGEVWEQVGPEIDLLSWWVTTGRQNRITLQEPPKKEQTLWTSRISEEHKEQIRTALQSGESVVVQVPVHVEPKPKVKVDGVPSPTWSYLDIVLKPEAEQSIPPSYYREGLRIAEVTGNKPGGIRAITIIEDPPLASMLALAEGPAHVDWTPRGTRFSGKFANGQYVVSFVKNAAGNLVKHARSGDSEQGVNLAGSFFNLDKVKSEKGSTTTSGGDEPETTGVVDPPDPTPKLVDVDQRADGFVVIAGEGLVKDQKVTLRMAYDVRRGNPFAKWKPLDFEVDGLTRNESGMSSFTILDNCVEFVIVDPESFRLELKGFDSKRDLIVNVEVAS